MYLLADKKGWNHFKCLEVMCVLRAIILLIIVAPVIFPLSKLTQHKKTYK